MPKNLEEQLEDLLVDVTADNLYETMDKAKELIDKAGDDELMQMRMMMHAEKLGMMESALTSLEREGL